MFIMCHQLRMTTIAWPLPVPCERSQGTADEELNNRLDFNSRRGYRDLNNHSLLLLRPYISISHKAYLRTFILVVETPILEPAEPQRRDTEHVSHHRISYSGAAKQERLGLGLGFSTWEFGMLWGLVKLQAAEVRP